jgi:hypothetical protein
MERVMGIEPTLPAWKAGVLPLNYTRIEVYGGSGRNRTADTRIFSPLLYRLSYRANYVWLGMKDSNLRMTESKSVALPLG